MHQVRTENDFLRIDTVRRLEQAVSDLSRSSEIIHLNPAILERSEVERIIGERTDNLILHCILEHARSIPEPKLFLSGNTKDFGGEAVRSVLRAAGVLYFAESQAVLGWLKSQPHS